MANDIEVWIVTERTIIENDIKNLESGGKITSASGGDITSATIERLKTQLEGANMIIEKFSEINNT